MKKWVLRIFTLIISVYSVTSSGNSIDLYVFIHIFIMCINSFSLFSYEDNPYSLFKVYHIFSLFFFGIAPVLQYYDNTRFLGERVISLDVKYEVSFCLLLLTFSFNFMYLIFYNFTKKSKKKEIILSKLEYFNLHFKGFNGFFNLLLISLSFMGFLVFFASQDFNIYNLLFRGGDLTETIEGEKAFGLIAGKIFRPLTLIIFILSYYYNSKNKILNFILFIIFFVTCFPLGLARNATAAFYLPILLLFARIFNKRHFFVTTMIAGILLIFPFLNNFRYFDRKSEISFGLNYEMFTDMHFDAYATFLRIVNMDLVTYGGQLLGVFFFFVPRSVWNSKPISSGQYHADLLGFNFNNVACTYYAEGYINFGYIGVVLFNISLAYFCAYLDKSFWMYKSRKSYFNIIYVLILGMFLFALRGDLMSGYSYTFGIILTAIGAYRFLVRVAKYRFR